MTILRTERSPRYVRPEGITSWLLVSPRTCGAARLATTLVEIAPGGEQRIHAHAPEQTYFILEGTGRMTVGAETTRVEAGDSVFIPSDAPHGLRNDGSGALRYFSAASPAFTGEELDAFWPLGSEADEGR